MMKSMIIAALAALALTMSGCGCTGDKCDTEVNTTDAVPVTTEATGTEVTETNAATAGTDTLETPAATPAQ